MVFQMNKIEDQTTGLVVHKTVTEFFHHSINDALTHQKVHAQPETIFYVVNLLTNFCRSENLFSVTEDGVFIQPLALRYAEAVGAATALERTTALRQLGDTALLVAGFFSDSLNRKPVDIDYYMAMGGAAYRTLGGDDRPSARWNDFSLVFVELADKFAAFVNVLDEVSESTPFRSNRNLMRIYELWLKTGNQRFASRLRAKGIEPIATGYGQRLS